MNEMFSLAVYMGKLEARLEALEKRLEGMDDAPKVQLGMGHKEEGEDPADKDAQLASRLMQEGIDNIMGYQWPPKREGK